MPCVFLTLQPAEVGLRQRQRAGRVDAGGVDERVSDVEAAWLGPAGRDATGLGTAGGKPASCRPCRTNSLQRTDGLPQGHSFVTIGPGGFATVFDRRTGKPVLPIPSSRPWINAARYSPLWQFDPHGRRRRTGSSLRRDQWATDSNAGRPRSRDLERGLQPRRIANCNWQRRSNGKGLGSGVGSGNLHASRTHRRDFIRRLSAGWAPRRDGQPRCDDPNLKRRHGHPPVDFEGPHRHGVPGRLQSVRTGDRVDRFRYDGPDLGYAQEGLPTD